MNIGEFIIKIGTQGDTKGLEQMARSVENAEKKTRRLITYLRELKEATSESEKKLIKKNFAHQIEADRLKTVIGEQNAYTASMQKTMFTSMKMIGAIKLGIIVLDRLGNSLIKANQMYTTFSRTTGMSVSRLNRMAGIAQMATTGLSPEQVAGDITSLQQKIFGFERFGENARTFGMLGLNPRGMKADQLIMSLRKSLKGYSAEVKSYYLNQLGLSQEWLNVIDLTDEKFKEYVEDSKKLQLTEKERKQLAEYTAKQQKNNMRWELAKQRLLISVMPLIQQIMEATSKIALAVSNMLEKNPQWLNVVKDILMLLAGNAVIRTISAISKLLTGGILGALMGIGGKTAGKGLLGSFGLAGLSRLASKKGLGAVGGVLAKRGAGMLGGLAGGPIGAIFSIAMGIWTIVDLFKLFTNKQDEENEDIEPAEDSTGTRYQYSNVRSNMTNNFYNNPQPAQEAIKQLSYAHNLLLAEQNR